MDFILLLKIIGWILLTIIVLYIIIRLSRKLKLVESSMASQSGEIEADQFYYLPGYGMNINATASLIIFRDQDGNFRKHELKNLKLATEIVLQPDTSQLVALTYKPDIYSSDDFSFTTSSESLLQNIAATTEDRLSMIIKDFAAAPGEALQESRANLAERKREVLNPETIEVARSFKIDASEVSKGEIKLDWKISIEGKNEKLDISQTLKNKNATAKASLSAAFDGVVTRPMSYQSWQLQNSNLPDASFTCFGPDASRLIKVPIRRGYFIKKQLLPKFSNGILVENHIIKPSEVEGVASIPINILKAIFSIPSQIFRFRIIRNNLQTELDKSLVEMLKTKDALADEQKKSKDRILSELQNLKEKVSQGLGQKGAGLPDDELPPLGKLPPLPLTEETKRSAKLRSENRITERLRFETEVPKSKFWNEKFKGDWRHYGNTIGGEPSCVPAAGAHMIICWSSNTQEAPVIPSAAAIKKLYEKVRKPGDGGPDGCHVSFLLDEWLLNGIEGNKIELSGPVKTKKRADLEKAIFLFGPALLGFDLPVMKKEDIKHWTVKDDSTGKWGRHAVCAVGYDEEGLVVISWGEEVRVDWEFYEKYNDESYVALSQLWVTENTSSPSGESFAVLNQIISILNA